MLDKNMSFILNPFKWEQMSQLPSNLVLNNSESKYILKTLSFPAEMKLVYRASENEFNLSKFHKICDDMENTFTVIKTEHSKLIGGFTPLKWKDRIGKDHSNSTFLLAINLKEKLEHIRHGECAIFSGKGRGPSFGGMFYNRDLDLFE